ncbi:hypothetical protein SAMN02745824_0548 [Parasphingorhabdus marina DSM 22363]|uniref:Uncharacterized protein n=1 Tax=Parasphingorhabdus marina DSM 22363 TaxID=1123272 RepID=A0A1N6CN27_9SPHN|nr:hypothetical protein SAMN02745824_0548 [Parasphingorhabdus marina DSM 22363]
MKCMVTILSLLLLSSCGADRSYKGIIVYDDRNELFQQAKEMLRNDSPEFFEALDSSQLIGFAVFGKEVECVFISHTTNLTVHVDVPLYCFDYATREFVTKL